jgi:hypothetical protein
MGCRQRNADPPEELFPAGRAVPRRSCGSRSPAFAMLGLLALACAGPNAGINESPEEPPVQPCQFPPAPTAYGSAKISCNVLDPTRGPPARDSSAIAYDEARQVVVLFGGETAQTGFADTWRYDGAGWTEVSVASSPSARFRHAMAYDADRRVVVLFGGFERTALRNLGDTWEYDGVLWTLVNTAVSPPAQSGHRLAYDSIRKRTILFGGTQTSGPLGATWEYDGTTWTEISYTVGPSPRANFGLAYDASRGRVVLHGGGAPVCAARYETWVYDGAWAPLNVPAPSLETHVLTYDPTLHDLMVVSHTELWQFNGASWLKLNSDSPPEVGLDQAAAFDQASGELVVYYYTPATGTAATWLCRRLD